MAAKRLSGDPVAASIREDVRERVTRLRESGAVPVLGTVLMSDSPADSRFMDLKHEACDDVGIGTRDVRLDPEGPASRLYDAVEGLSADPAVDAVFVQTPLPNHVDLAAVRRRIDPARDVDCFHPENAGRLVAGEPRFLPATPAAVLRLLEWYDITTAGQSVVVVGRSPVIGRPLANLLIREGWGNATVTVCHSRTRNLGEKTRHGDLVITAAGVPELVDGSMLSPGAVVVDVSANRRPGDGDGTVVGDVIFGCASEVAGAITPVPGGVGPVTLSCLVANAVKASERRCGEASDGP